MVAYFQSIDVLKSEKKNRMTGCWRTWNSNDVSAMPWASSTSFFVQPWDKLLQEDPALIATLPKGLSQAVCCFSLTLEHYLWNGAFNQVYPLFSCSRLPSQVAAQIPPQNEPVARFRLGFLLVRTFICISPLEENEVSAHLSVFRMHFFLCATSCFWMTSNTTASIGLKLLHNILHPHYHPTIFSWFKATMEAVSTCLVS